MSPPEAKMWVLLRTEPFRAQHWRRQVPIGPYFADFASLSERVIVEIDGAQHFEDAAMARDAQRTAYLEEQGFRVVRFNTLDVLRGIEGVADVLVAELSLRR